MIPAASTRVGFWRRLARRFRRRPRLIARCARCGCALDNGQWLPSLPAEREVCGGTCMFDPMTGQLCRWCFDERAKAVYWDREPACNAIGPTKARCLLPVRHRGVCEGNGFDDYGPIYRCWGAA